GPDEPRERIARKLYRDRIPVSKPHVVDQACELVSAALGEPIEPGRAILPIGPEHELWANREIGNERFCLIAPRAGWGAKEWPAERYGELSSELNRLGYSVLVNATSDDDESARAVARASGGT